VWGPTYERETNYLRSYMATIRRKLEPDPSRPRYFRTEPGIGVRFVPGGVKQATANGQASGASGAGVQGSEV